MKQKCKHQVNNGWCSNNEHESSCDQVCSEHEF